MAFLSNIGSRRVIMVETDVGVPQPLCDASGTPIGYDEANMFDPDFFKRSRALEDKARSIARRTTEIESLMSGSIPSRYPKLRDYREVK
jgi:hypothetical protein